METTKQSGASVAAKTTAKRTDFLIDGHGDAIGSNWKVPQANFARFMGVRPLTTLEKQGKQPLSAVRIMEYALSQRMQQIGQGAAKRGNTYSTIFSASDTFANKPGHSAETIKEVLDSVKESVEKGSMESKGLQMGGAASNQYMSQLQKMQTDSHNDNVRYLEMQYRFDELGKQDSVLSNLMKARHDAVTRTIRG